MTLCPNQDWSWLGSRPLRTSSPLTDRQRLQKSSWNSGNPGVIQNVCQWVRDGLSGKRPGPRQQESTSQNWRQRAQNFCLQLETTGARSPGSRRMGGPSSWRGREHSKSVRPPSTRAQEGSKEANVQRGKSFAHAARQVVARVWCKSSLLSTVHGNHTAAYRRA